MSAESRTSTASFTTKLVPGNARNVAAKERSGSCQSIPVLKFPPELILCGAGLVTKIDSRIAE